MSQIHMLDLDKCQLYPIILLATQHYVGDAFEIFQPRPKNTPVVS